MTNEEKAREIANDDTLYGEDSDNNSKIDECYIAALEMARWKDEQYKEREEGLREIIDALEASLQKANDSGMYYFDQCNIQKKQLIDKACEWLRRNMYEGTCDQILSKKPYPFMKDFIEEFRQAMEGGAE